jgi:hypothetical protein
VVRIVCDGSTDKRIEEVTYAETPDRTLLYMMASIEDREMLLEHICMLHRWTKN